MSGNANKKTCDFLMYLELELREHAEAGFKTTCEDEALDAYYFMDDLAGDIRRFLKGDRSMSFTEGKWEVKVLYDDHFGVFANEHVVADCFGNGANAHLIAAAPEMYRTLVKVLDDTQNGQHASENELIALLNTIDGEDREFNYMYPIP